MTNKPLIAKITKENIDNFLSSPNHALIISGQLGIGKITIARYISAKLLNIDSVDDLINYPYYYEISPDNKTITIDQIRELKKLLNLKTTGKLKIRRILTINKSDLMNEESQNAILKILEEPPEDTLIILSTNNDKKIKPTIRSRSQIINIQKPTLTETINYFVDLGFNKDQISKHYVFTNGSVGLISSFLNDNEEISKYFIDESKQIINFSKFDKLLEIESLSKDKDSIFKKLFTLKQIIKVGLKKSIEKNDLKSTKYWLRSLHYVQDCEDNLTMGANTKLALTNLFLLM